MLRFALFIIASVGMMSCHSVDKKSLTPGIPEPGLVNRLKHQKSLVDTLYDQKRGTSLTLLKQTGSNRLIQLMSDSIPDDAEATYTIFKDSSGKIFTASEFPVSESGDWYIVLTHYFDNNGKTFAFERQTNFFNSGCTEGVAYETKTEYYNDHFQLIGREYKLIDEKNRPLKKDSCAFLYEYDYKVADNAQNYLKSINWKNGD